MRLRLAKRFGLRLERALVAYDANGKVAHLFKNVDHVCLWTSPRLDSEAKKRLEMPL
jgi:hypothetical protein